MADKATDLRAHLLDLYLVNNPEIAHRVFISIFKVKTTSFSWLALAFKISLKKLESYL